MIDINEFSSEFLFYLLTTFEDNPLPDECENLFFVIRKDLRTFHLEIVPSELDIKFTFLTVYYSPLNYEYFFCDYKKFKNISEFKETLTLALDIVSQNETLKAVFCHRHIKIVVL